MDEPVAFLRTRPLTEQVREGSWRAWWDEIPVEAFGSTKDEAVRNLDAEAERLFLTDGEFRSKVASILAGMDRHPSVQRMSRDDYDQLMVEALSDESVEYREVPIETE